MKSKRLPGTIELRCYLLCVGVVLCVGWAQGHAQAGAAKSGGAAAGGDFSIETEMLTYRAVQTNSEALACDVASYLYNTQAVFTKASSTKGPSSSTCSLGAHTAAPGIGVIVLPFGSPDIEEFNVWRSDMYLMADIQERYKCTVKKVEAKVEKEVKVEKEGKVEKESTQEEGTRGLAATPAASTAASLLVPPAISAGTAAAGGILALLSSQREVTSVGGTVQDQALIDGVSRELLRDGVAVVSPTSYEPRGLMSIKQKQSPYFAALQRLAITRDCLATNGKSDNAAKAMTDLGITQIDNFFAILRGEEPSSKSSGTGTKAQTSPKGTSPSSSTSPSSGPSTSSGSSTSPDATPTPTASPTGLSHLHSILAADGLAQRLNVDPDSGEIPESGSQHLLMLRALESGGSVVRFTNVLGTRISYSGGAVDTYALFDLNGKMECSGNVYEYSGPLPGKSFRKKLRGQQLDPADQMIFQNGGCHR